MDRAARRIGLKRALLLASLAVVLVISAGAAVLYAVTSPDVKPSPAPAAAANPADSEGARYAHATPAATKQRHSRVIEGDGADASEAPEADESGTDAWLGVVLADLSGDDDDAAGIRVTSVAGGSPAEEAGLKKGDRIVRMEKSPIDDYGDIVRFMRGHRPGDDVTIIVLRGGEKTTLSATLGDEPRTRRRSVHVIRGGHDDDDGDHDGEDEDFIFEMPEPPEPPDAPGAPRAPHARHLHAMAMMAAHRPMLGVSVHPMSQDLRAFFKAPDDSGLLVDRVIEGSAAAKAGLKAGDVIIAVGDQDISNSGDIGEALGESKAGDEVDVRIIRDGAEKTLKVVIQKGREDGERGHMMFGGPEGMEWKALKGLGEHGELLKLKHLEALTPEIQQEIDQALREAHEQVRDAMKRVHEELREQKIHLKSKAELESRVQRDVERQLRREVRELRGQERIRTIQRTKGVASYDL